ncbi:MAG: ROK family protein [Actinomycetia bacterium]|nr:ROK family protein [Actinomycetes bacterium]
MNTLPYAIGVDVGGTKIAAILIDRQGEILARSFALVPPEPTSDKVVELCAEAVREVQGARLPDDIAGVGLAIPGFIDVGQQRILRCVNLPLEACDMQAQMQEALGLPVVMDNDATLAMLGEARYGAARGVMHALMLTLGTGVGGGLLIGGELYHGARGLAGEVGHTVIVAGGDLCPCGGRGHLESYLGREALARRARDAARTPEGAGILSAAGGVISAISAETLLDAADAGDRCADRILREAGELLGLALVTFVNLLAPESIIIAGGLGERAPQLIDAARDRLETERPPGIVDLTVACGALGNDAGAFGAGALAFDRA